MCELYCAATHFMSRQLRSSGGGRCRRDLESGWLGQFRRDSGWMNGAMIRATRNEHWRMDQIFARARAMTSST